jgi:hypothetical protein
MSKKFRFQAKGLAFMVYPPNDGAQAHIVTLALTIGYVSASSDLVAKHATRPNTHSRTGKYLVRETGLEFTRYHPKRPPWATKIGRSIKAAYRRTYASKHSFRSTYVAQLQRTSIARQHLPPQPMVIRVI